MRSLITILFIVLSLFSGSVFGCGSQTLYDNGQTTVIDYPDVLLKAGVKKVRCIFKESRKFIWIGTENGLYRYDGTNVDILQHDPGDPNTIPSNTIDNITEDRQGNIWVGTLEGIARIDSYTMTCTVYDKELHNLDDIFDLKVYADPEGRIWAGGVMGLNLYDRKKDVFNKVWKYKTGAESKLQYINCLTDWKKDTLVVGTFDGALLIDKHNFGYRKLPYAESGVTVTRVFTDASGKIWLGTWDNGCILFDSKGKNYKTLKWEKGEGGEIVNIITGFAHTDYNNDSRLWVSTTKGVYELKNFQGDLSDCNPVPFFMGGGGSIKDITADGEQYIWIAGSEVARFFAGKSIFTTISQKIGGAVQDIQPISIKGQQDVAVSSWYVPSGLTILDQKGDRVIYRQPAQADPDVSNISGIVADKYGRFWVSSFRGIQVLDPDLKQVRNNDKLFTGKDAPLSSKTNAILISHDTVWVACYKRGINLYDLNFHKLKTFTDGDGSGLVDGLILRFFADNHNNVWLCGNNRLYRYNKLDGNFKAYNFNKDGLAFTVNDITQLPDGGLLIASSSGLFRFNPVTGVYKQITSPFLKDNNIITASVDRNGDIWFINSEHLVYYQVRNNHFTFFGIEDGLDVNDGLQWLKTTDGKHFYLAESHDIIAFSPGRMKNLTAPVKMYIHAIQVNDSSLNRSTFTAPLRLKYNENRINLEFGAINYIKPDQNLYAYRLSNVDDKWVNTTRNFASYANLAPGKYTFSLKAENYEGIWSKPVSLQLIITPPFWATWWFRIIAFLVIGSMLFFAIRYVLQRNLRERILRLEKEQAVEKERNRIARDMHDDLGSGLTKIAILSEVTKTQVREASHATANLDVISTASRELVDNLQDIIWVLNPKNDSLNSLVLYIREYIEGFFEPAGIHSEFVYEGAQESKISLSEEKRRNIFLAVKESCNNILKHAHCDRVYLNIKLMHKRLVISIKDNGCGFDISQVGNFSNGLQNMGNRMEQIGGRFSISGSKEHGTSVTLDVPV
ncbi:MAG TPA: two-component regulator propeller domain-containing protein [Mucilaginibacter sp.]|nr:two-component regulator propeller domain-containing protein [Mucilaginibacter sp.]